MSEDKKNIKNLKDRLNKGVKAEGGAPAVAPPGMEGKVTLPPVVPPPGVPLPPPQIAPPGLELPPSLMPTQAPVAPPPQPVYVEPEPPKPISIKGKIDDETADLAGLNRYATVKKVLVAIVPGALFLWIGFIIGNLWFQSKVIALQKDETNALWKKVRNQDQAIASLGQELEKQITQKMKGFTPDKAIADANAFSKSVNPKDFFPDDGLFLPTTPLIDNGKKDTDPRYLSQLLDYQDATSQFLIGSQLHVQTTTRDKAQLQAGFEKIMNRAVELKGPDTDPTIAEIVGALGVLTNAPWQGFGLELDDKADKGHLVVVKEIAKEANPQTNKEETKSYTVFDARFGAKVPEDAKEIRKDIDKKKVALIDRGNARLFMLNRDTVPVEKYFTTLYNLTKAQAAMRANRADASNALENALKAPSASEGGAMAPAAPAAAPAAPAPAAPAAPAAGGAPAGEAPKP